MGDFYKIHLCDFQKRTRRISYCFLLLWRRVIHRYFDPEKGVSITYPLQQKIQSVLMKSAICALRYRFSARERKGGRELAVKLKYTCNTSRSRAVIKRRGPGISPGYYERFPQLLSEENRRKIEPREIPSCLIPRLLVVFTQQLEILVTTLSEGNSKTSNGTLAIFYYTTINRFKGRLGTDH